MGHDLHIGRLLATAVLMGLSFACWAQPKDCAQLEREFASREADAGRKLAEADREAERLYKKRVDHALTLFADDTQASNDDFIINSRIPIGKDPAAVAEAALRMREIHYEADRDKRDARMERGQDLKRSAEKANRREYNEAVAEAQATFERESKGCGVLVGEDTEANVVRYVATLCNAWSAEGREGRGTWRIEVSGKYEARGAAVIGAGGRGEFSITGIDASGPNVTLHGPAQIIGKSPGMTLALHITSGTADGQPGVKPGAIVFKTVLKAERCAVP